MGLFDKFLFWRKKEDFSFDDDMKKSAFAPPFEQEGQPLEGKSAFGESPFGEKPPFEPGELGREAAVPSPEKPDFASGAGQRSAPLSSASRFSSGAQPSERELELINSKLDTLKAILQSFEQRLANLERAAGVEKRERLW